MTNKPPPKPSIVTSSPPIRAIPRLPHEINPLVDAIMSQFHSVRSGIFAWAGAGARVLGKITRRKQSASGQPRKGSQPFPFRSNLTCQKSSHSPSSSLVSPLLAPPSPSRSRWSRSSPSPSIRANTAPTDRAINTSGARYGMWRASSRSHPVRFPDHMNPWRGPAPAPPPKCPSPPSRAAAGQGG